MTLLLWFDISEPKLINRLNVSALVWMPPLLE